MSFPRPHHGRLMIMMVLETRLHCHWQWHWQHAKNLFFVKFRDTGQKKNNLEYDSSRFSPAPQFKLKCNPKLSQLSIYFFLLVGDSHPVVSVKVPHFYNDRRSGG